jgi:ubiquinone/menaquinone biosynthesis C-methylase UbiE
MNNDAAFVGSIPANYDRYLGPFLFEPFARDLAARVDWVAGARVLELACGTGRLTRHLAGALTGGQQLTATDLNADMVSYARSVVPAGDAVIWQTADAADLSFDDERFDTVVCQFGLMFLPDKGAALREWIRVLVPGGQLLVSVWDAMEHSPASAIVHRTVVDAFPDDPPLFITVPHSMHDQRALHALVEAAGFVDIVVEEVDLVGESTTAADFARGFVYGSPLHTALAARAPDRVDEIHELVSNAVAAGLGDNPMRSPLRALTISARRPA